VERGAWSVERGAWSVERGAWSVERGAWSVERGAWSVDLQIQIASIGVTISYNYFSIIFNILFVLSMECNIIWIRFQVSKVKVKESREKMTLQEYKTKVKRMFPTDTVIQNKCIERYKAENPPFVRNSRADYLVLLADKQAITEVQNMQEVFGGLVLVECGEYLKVFDKQRLIQARKWLKTYRNYATKKA
jgi:hypothetical protein